MKTNQTEFQKVNAFSNEFGIYKFEDLPVNVQSKILSKIEVDVMKSIDEMGLVFEGNNPSKHTLISYVKENLNSIVEKKYYSNIQGKYYELVSVE